MVVVVEICEKANNAHPVPLRQMVMTKAHLENWLARNETYKRNDVLYLYQVLYHDPGLGRSSTSSKDVKSNVKKLLL
jgi:hypothetical protein